MTQAPTQYLLSGNVVVNIENVTGGKASTDEGLVDIVTECTFTVIYKNLRFGVEAHWITDDHDQYGISVYDQSEEKNRYRREDSNEICYAYLDSTGGGVSDEGIYVAHDGVELDKVEDAIMSILFGNPELGIEAYIKPF